MQTAFICRYGAQDVHKIRGLDRPLYPLERHLFALALEEHVRAEFSPRDEPAAPKEE
jgi:hypothetical protein